MKDNKVKALRQKIADLEAENEGLRRSLRVRDVEIESLAAVIARDRERVRADSAEYARKTAPGA